MADDGTLTTGEVAVLAGVSYRQLDKWVSLGHIPISDVHPGHGYVRRWTPREVRHARVLATLVRIGMLPTAAAAAIRNGDLLVNGARFDLRLTHDVRISGALT